MPGTLRYEFTLLVVDPMEFRRRAIVAEFAQWAETAGVQVAAIAPDALEDGGSWSDPETAREPTEDTASERTEASPFPTGSTTEMGVEGDAPFPRPPVELILLSPGVASLSGPEVRRWVSLVRSRLSDRPLALLSDRPTADEALAAIRLGAQGLVPLSLPSSVVHHALLFIRDGGTYFPPEALLDLSSEAHGGRRGLQGAAGQGLTTRQIEVLDLLRLGSSNKVIARRLDMQESTVKVHVRHILRKLGAANRTQAALIAAELMRGDEASSPCEAAPEPTTTPSAAPHDAGAPEPVSALAPDASVSDVPAREAPSPATLSAMTGGGRVAAGRIHAARIDGSEKGLPRSPCAIDPDHARARATRGSNDRPRSHLAH